MAIGTPVDVYNNADKASGATDAVTISVAVPAGSTIVACYSVDGDGADSSGAIESVTDVSGNTYQLAAAASTGTTNAGVAAGIYYAKNVAALAANDNITFNFIGSSAPTASAHSIFYVTGLDSTSPLDVTGTATGTSTTPSVSTSATTTQADVLTIGIVGTEGPSGDTFTQDASPAYATPPVRAGTTSGSAVTNITVAGGYFIETAAGVKTYNPTLGTSRDWASVIVTFKGAAASKAFPFRRPSFNHILVR